MNSPIYLDNNATTKVAPEVFEAMRPYLAELYGNASSMYRFGGRLGAALNTAREQTAALLGAAPEEIVFTSCGTESDATAIWSALRAQPDKRHIVTTQVEHPAVLTLCKHCGLHGYSVTFLPVDEKGLVSLDALAAALRDDTALVSMMYANNESGVIFPVAEAAAMAGARGIPFHTDAVQAVGKIPIRLSGLPVDYLALSGHKLHAPKGIGALYVRRGAKFRPFLLGGQQEYGRRAGTENVAFIVALGKAAELAAARINEENTAVRALRDRLETGLMSAIPEAVVNGDSEKRLPNTLNIAFRHIEGEAILLMLDRLGICASSGSACASGKLEPSNVLRATGVPVTHVHGSVRFSLSRYTTQEEIDYVVRELPPIVARLRELSPFGKGTPRTP
ncbi:MAG: cysteine desulfurase NifS [Deltaproteobacteria bacterium]|jgi:cysteine desulfurase|nr:cysteine desulfurase NifS [Deltaproteobacteria bacterium]